MEVLDYKSSTRRTQAARINWVRRYLIAVPVVAVIHASVSLMFLHQFNDFRISAFYVDGPSEHLGYALFIGVVEFPMSWIPTGQTANLMFNSAEEFRHYFVYNSIFWGFALTLLWHALSSLRHLLKAAPSRT